MTVVEAEAPVGRRERKKAATRAALSEAAVRLSLEHGVEHVTVEQIADAADIALRTFFNYFSSKEEAVVAGDTARGDLLLARFRERPAPESVLTALRAAFQEHVGDLAGDEHWEALQLLRRSPSLLPHQLAAYAARERALAVAIAGRIGEPVPDDGDDGAAPVGLYPSLVAATTIAGLRVAMQRRVDRAGGRPDVAALRDDLGAVFDRLAAGLDDR